MNAVRNIDLSKQAEFVFRELMPKHGLTVREEQVRLCLSALDTHLHHEIALFDAGTGIGKTYSYLVAGLLARQRDPMRRPVLVSTSSVALQSAILQTYVPFLTEILLEAKIIDKPLSAVIRKGKAHYVCDRRLERRLAALRASEGRLIAVPVDGHRHSAPCPYGSPQTAAYR